MKKTGQENKLYFKTSLALLIIIIIFLSNMPQSSAAIYNLTGFVQDEATGVPIPNAKLTVLYRRYTRYWYQRWSSYGSTTTDTHGRYHLRLNTDTDYLILVSHLNSDGEHNYIPQGLIHNPTTEHEEKNIELWKASIITFEGLAYFIETTSIPETTFRVLDLDSNEIFRYGSLNLLYGQRSGSLSSHFGLPTNKIYVPSGRRFLIEAQSYAQRSGENIHKTLVLNDYEDTILEHGEMIRIDLRSYILSEGINKLQNETMEVEKLIFEKEKEGFFLSVERQQLSKILHIIKEAILLDERELYAEAFTKLRESYVLITDLENGLENMLIDASRSVYLLIGFIALTSTILSSLIFEKNQYKVTVSLVVFIFLFLSLYYLHPGAQIADIRGLVNVSALSLIFVNILTLFLPRFLNRSSSGRDISLVNMIVPILSIAKRSLRRRTLRFALTLTSVLLLVASFISLTSFDSGYGLSFSKTTGNIMKEGIMIRTPNPPPEKATAPFSGGTGVAASVPLDETLLQWYGQLTEVKNIAPRFENIAQRQYRELYNPVASINQTPIFGIVSIDPKLEAEINHLDSALVKGEYLSEEIGETVISTGLAEKIDVELGDTFTMKTREKDHELIVVGLFDDNILEKLTDIDGKSILPSKIIEWERIELDGPDYVIEALTPCSSDEVVWVNLNTGNNITALWLLRINLLLQEDVNILDFARSTALDRGHRAWASTFTGVYLAELTEYFEGKGLPIAIPWIIVVLNVIVTMMNAYYERRHEVMIYSSIGMNPRHISSIFLAEAAVIGILGGCFGYIMGLGAYKIIYILTPVLQVKQKVSAFWSIAAICISLMAVIVGGLTALRNSTSITPSLRRRWNIDNKQEYSLETRIVIPIQVYEEEIDEYIDFMYKKLKAWTGRNLVVKMLKVTQTSKKSWEYRYIYSSANSQIAALYSKNRINVEKSEGKTYSTILNTIGDSDSIKEAGSLIRQIGLEWSLQREKGYSNGNF